MDIAQAILYRGSGFEARWSDLVAVTVIGAVFFLDGMLAERVALKENGLVPLPEQLS